jgi:hypothetical protein
MGSPGFAPSKTSEIMKSELAGDRYTLAYKSKPFVVVDMLVRSGAKSLECCGTHSSPNGIADPVRLAAWFEMVCATMKPR